MHPAHCGKWNRKLKPKVANGCAGGWRKNSRPKPTATAGFSPQSGRKAHHRRQAPMHLRTAFGAVGLSVWHGKDPADGHWGCPLRERWDLSAHQQLSPALEDKLGYFATVTGSYEAAAKLAAKMGCPVEDSTIQALVQRLGAKAEAQTQARLEKAPEEKHPARAPTPLAVLMLDGFQVRFRGAGWGKRKTGQPRVEWHEAKLGVFYRHERAVGGARGQLLEKVVVGWQGEGLELGRRLHWEAQRGGLGRAKAVLAVADGAPWIWNVVTDRWGQAQQLLDFYHASQHLWSLGEALHPKDEVARRAWVEARLHRLRHGSEKAVLREIGALPRWRGETGKVIRREANYFAEHAGRMNYETLAQRGWPVGSGAVESGCRSRQCRRKRPGQFWTRPGLRHLDALEEARDNGHWDELWLTA
jgi:hypothetical protein